MGREREGGREREREGERGMKGTHAHKNVNLASLDLIRGFFWFCREGWVHRWELVCPKILLRALNRRKHKQHSLKLYAAKIRLATEFRAWLTTQIQSESIAHILGIELYWPDYMSIDWLYMHLLSAHKSLAYDWEFLANMVEVLSSMASDFHVLGEVGVPCWEMKTEEAPLSSSQRGAPTIIIMHLHYIIISLYGWTVDKKWQRY